MHNCVNASSDLHVNCICERVTYQMSAGRTDESDGDGRLVSVAHVWRR